MTGSALKRRRVRWIVVAALAAVCTVIVSGALYVAHIVSIFGGCETVVHSSIPSPDLKKSVVIFERECGATVPFNTQASIAPADGSFSPEKNPAFFVISGRQDVTAKWLGDGAIEILVIPGGSVLRSEPRVGDIKIEYD